MSDIRSLGPSASLLAILMLVLLPLSTTPAALSDPQGLDPGKLSIVWEYERTGSDATFWKLDWSPDGSMVACCFFDTTCVVLNATDGGVRTVLVQDTGTTRCDGYSPEGTLPMRACSFSPDGNILAVGGDTREISLYDTGTWELRRTLRGHQGSVLCLDFSPDGSYLASGSGRDKVVPNNMGENKTFIWDLTSFEVVKVLTGHKDGVLSVKWSPNGTRLATASDDRTLRLWSFPEGIELKSGKGHTSGALDVDWSPDGSMLMTGSRDYKVKVWNSTTLEELMSWSDHNCVRSVDIHPTEELAATGGVDLTLKVRDLRTGTELKVLKEGMVQHAMVMSARWSPDGRMLVSGLGKSHTVIMYSFTGSGLSDDGFDMGPLTIGAMVLIGTAVTVVIFIPAIKELRRRRD